MDFIAKKVFDNQVDGLKKSVGFGDEEENEEDKEKDKEEKKKGRAQEVAEAVRACMWKGCGLTSVFVSCRKQRKIASAKSKRSEGMWCGFALIFLPVDTPHMPHARQKCSHFFFPPPLLISSSCCVAPDACVWLAGVLQMVIVIREEREKSRDNIRSKYNLAGAKKPEGEASGSPAAKGTGSKEGECNVM